MFQSRTHTCNDLRMEHAGADVTIVGWYENLRKVSKNLGFLVLRDFYGTTQVVIETEESHMYSVEDNYYNTVNIDSTIYEKLPKVFQDMCEEIDFVRYHYELTPKAIAVEKIIDSVNNNFKSLMELAD